MLNRYTNSAHTAGVTTRRAIARRPRQLGSWQAHAIAAYRQAHERSLAELPTTVSAGVSALIGKQVAPEAVFVDADTGVAAVVVDGVTFRSHDGQIVLLRVCAECGTRYFESLPLATPADLGFALSAWKPLCPGCQPEDPANWLDS
jgi:hypothetical protein